MNIKNRLYMSAGISIILVLIGISVGGCKEQPVKPEEIEKVTLGIRPGVMGSVVWVADAKGFFKEEGLDVTLKEYSSGKGALIGMFNNEVEIGTAAEAPLTFNSFERQDFLLFGSIGYSDKSMKIIARKDRGINSATDLEGKKIAVHKSSASHYFLSVFLMQNLIPESEVNIVYMESENLVPAIINGEIDAFSWRDPGTQYAKDALGDNAVEFSTPGLYRKTFDVIAMKDFIKNRPETIKMILRALLKAEKFIQKEPAEAIAIIARISKVEKEEIATIWDDFDLRVSLDQSLIVTMEAEARWAIKNNLTDKTEVPNYLDYIYMDALEKVKQEAVGIMR